MKNKVKYDEQFNSAVADVLKESRTRKHLSLRAAGSLVGISGQALKYYESGRTPIPLPVFFALSRAIGDDPFSLLLDAQKKSG